VSHQHVQRLLTIQQEFAAVTAATTYLSRVWHQVGDLPEIERVRFSHLQEARRNLEITYIMRLFSEFEALLIDHPITAHPGLRIPRTAEALINRVALRERLPDATRDAAKAVREYRNLVVHRRADAASVLSFSRATAALNRFLAQLP
jgi:hypothetical protein